MFNNEPNPNLDHCDDCGKVVSVRADMCPHCGAPRRVAKKTSLVVRSNYRSRAVAAVMAALGGGLGLHHFYLGQHGRGVLSLLFWWTGIPFILGWIAAYRFATMTPEEFVRLYGDFEQIQVAPPTVSTPKLLHEKNDSDEQTAAPAKTIGEDDRNKLIRELAFAKEARAAAQLDQFSSKLSAFMSVLGMRFQTNEISYVRYADAVKVVIDRAVENFESILALAQAIGTVDAIAIRDRIDVLESDAASPMTEILTLKERLSLYEELTTQRDQLLAINEQALTALTRVTTKLASVTTNVGATTNMDYLLDDLREISERAERYGQRIVWREEAADIKNRRGDLIP